MTQESFDPDQEVRKLQQDERDALADLRLRVEHEVMAAPFPPPNWAKWRARGAVDLWQLVALGCNVEPLALRRVVYFVAWHDRPAHSRAQDIEFSMLPRLRDDRSFAAMLALACSWVGIENGLPSIGSVSSESPEQARVLASTFVSWAGGIGWQLPEPMLMWNPEPAGPQLPSQDPRPAQTEAWRQQEILNALIGLGFDPAKLPPPPKGIADPAKQGAWGVLADREAKEAWTKSVFNKAWKALSSNGRLVRQKAVPGSSRPRVPT